jgi:hypothetical protein
MRWLVVLLSLNLLLGSVAMAAEGRVLKVLPQFLDLKGHASISPSLYDRDAYQALLRRNPGKRSTIRYVVQWKAKAPAGDPLKLRVEMRGTVKGDLPKQTSLEVPVHPPRWFSGWTNLTLSESAYKSFGEVTAWRVTLWDGDKMLSEQKSFLW